MSLMDIHKRIVKEEEKYFKDFRLYAVMIRDIASRLLGDDDLEVIVFGSVVKNRAIPGVSDIDILIVSSKFPLKPRLQAELRVKILRELGDLLAPFEIHFATPEIYRKWYKKMIDKFIVIKD